MDKRIWPNNSINLISFIFSIKIKWNVWFWFKKIDMGQPIVVSGAYSHFCPNEYDCERWALCVMQLLCIWCVLLPLFNRRKKNMKSHTPNPCTYKFSACRLVIHSYKYNYIRIYIFFLLFSVCSILVFPAKIDLDSDMSLMWWQLWQQHYYACCATFFASSLLALCVSACVLKSKNIRRLQPYHVRHEPVKPKPCDWANQMKRSKKNVKFKI